MKKLFSWVLSCVLIFNPFVAAFANDCNYKGMLRSKTNPSWFDSECVIGISCKYLPTKNNAVRDSLSGGIDTYKKHLYGKWSSLTPKEQDQYLHAVHVFTGGFGSSGRTNVILPSGEVTTRTITPEEWNSAKMDFSLACAKKESSGEQSASGQGRPGRGRPGQKPKAFIPGLKYENAEIMYPSSENAGDCGKDLESAMKNHIKHIYNQGDYCKRNGTCTFDIDTVVRTMLAQANKAACDDKEYLTSQNLRYLFLAYALLLDNTPEDTEKLVNYIKGGYSERVQAAAANAAMALSKYKYNVKTDAKEVNSPSGALDFNLNQREIIAAAVSWEYMRTGLSQEGYALYQNNINRVIDGYDKNKLIITDGNGDVVSSAVMPSFTGALLLSMANGNTFAAAVGAAEGVSFSIEITHGGYYISRIVQGAKVAADAASRAMAHAVQGAVVVEASALSVILAGGAIVGAMIYELNNAFSGSYLRAKKDSLNKYVSQLIAGATVAAEGYEYVRSTDVPLGVMEMVRGVNKITISRSKANAYEISLDKNNPRRITCREITGRPAISDWCINNLDACIKESRAGTAAAKELLASGGYQDPGFKKALKYEDKIASTKYPAKPIVWRLVYDIRTGGWTPYGELPVYPWEVNMRNVIQITTQFAEDEVFQILQDVMNGAEISLKSGDTTIRIGRDEIQGGRDSRREPNAHLHFEEIQYFSDGQPYICNHAIYFDVNQAGRKMTPVDYAEALLNMFY